MVMRRPSMNPSYLVSGSASHTPTTRHFSPQTPVESPPKLGIGARLKALSISYRPRPRDRSPKVKDKEQPIEGSLASSRNTIGNGAPGSFRFRAVTTGSFFRTRGRDKERDKKKESDAPKDANEHKENGDMVTTRM
ncbi:hypothetical protein O0L34_g8317 [Tuta absoluta]|nr:hypothetical protein O0L34_g8317 [Tuta absoluta]